MRVWLRCAAIIALLIGALSCRAIAASVDVEADGSGQSREAALADALTEAIQQVTGVAVNATQQMRTAISENAGAAGSSVTLNEASQAEIGQVSHGVVRSYRIINAVQDGAEYRVHLSVTIEKFEPKGLGYENRRRIAVAEFGSPAASPALSAALRDRLTDALTQSRRFAVLDRANEAAYSREMAVLANAPLADRVRAGQVVGADYVVVGTIRQAGVSRSDRTVELTGERVHSASSAIEVDVQVIEIATRQVKWGDTVRVSGGGESLDGLVDRAAARIAAGITQTIYPMRLIKFDDPAELVIDQGGDGVHAGERLRAMLLGQQLVDPYTKEPLGQAEREVGVVEVLRVDPKLSYAKLVSGRLPPAGSEVVLRAASNPSRRAASAARPNAPPVVKLPGDP